MAVNLICKERIKVVQSLIKNQPVQCTNINQPVQCTNINQPV